MAGVVQRQDVWVVELGGDLDLAQEAAYSQRGREFRTQDLDRDSAMVLEVLAEVHGGHATAADLPLDGITVDESLFEPVQNVGHDGICWSRGKATRRYLKRLAVCSLPVGPATPNRGKMLAGQAVNSGGLAPAAARGTHYTDIAVLALPSFASPPVSLARKLKLPLGATRLVPKVACLRLGVGTSDQDPRSAAQWSSGRQGRGGRKTDP